MSPLLISLVLLRDRNPDDGTVSLLNSFLIPAPLVSSERIPRIHNLRNFHDTHLVTKIL